VSPADGPSTGSAEVPVHGATAAEDADVAPKGDETASGVAAPKDTDAVPKDTAIRQMELVVSWVLRIGVVLSVALVAAGIALYFVQHPADAKFAHGVPYRHVVATSFGFPHTFSGLVHSLAKGRGQGVVVLGLVVLLATPVARVAVGVVGFARDGDLKMTLATSWVLLVLLISIFLVGR
jgi:uncharacterized membrane protein